MAVFEVNPLYDKVKKLILNSILNFNNSGEIFIKGNRNTIKLFQIEEKIYNIKSFKSPNLVNKIAYRYFRKSKAKRSFEFATLLIEKGIGTPNPIAFY